MLGDWVINEARNAEGFFFQNAKLSYCIVSCNVYFHAIEFFFVSQNTAIQALPEITCVCLWSRAMCGLCDSRCMLTICYKVKFKILYKWNLQYSYLFANVGSNM